MEEKNKISAIFEDEEYIKIVGYILNHDEFQKRKNFVHHGEVSVYEHSLRVSYLAYRVAKRMKADYVIAALGGILHDFYYQDWHIPVKRKIFQQHGFVHAKEAITNTEKYFPEVLNKRTKNCIARHMFPLNPIPPIYLESWIVTVVDKAISMEIFKKPSQLSNYIGIKTKKKELKK